MLRRVQADAAAAAGAAPGGGRPDLRMLPGGVGNTTHGEGIARGIGYAVGYKNVGFSEGYDDYSTARVRLEAAGGEPVVTVHTAAAEVGQGLVTIEQQIVPAPSWASATWWSSRRTPASARPDPRPRPARPTSPAARSRRRASWSASGCWRRSPGGAARPCATCGWTTARIWSARESLGPIAAFLGDGRDRGDRRVAAPADQPGRPGDRSGRSRTCSTRSPRTARSSTWTPSSAWSRSSRSTAPRTSGKAINPQAVAGQIQGGSAQGLGLAVMEEIQVRDGMIRNPSFTDYLIPTILDMPPMRIEVLEYPDPHAPYGLRGVGEPPTISSGPAIVAAIRAATGLPLNQVPVRPEHITGTEVRTARRGSAPRRPPGWCR